MFRVLWVRCDAMCTCVYDTFVQFCLSLSVVRYLVLMLLLCDQIRRRGYGKGVDYWALGCLIYEMLTSTVPFSPGV